MKLRHLILLGAALIAPVRALPAQETVFRVNVKLVRLLATVKSNTGELVGNLGKNEFTVYDSGVKQEIAVFERDTQRQLSVALLVDTSASTGAKLKEETRSVVRFLGALFREGNERDAVSLYSFNDDVTLQSSFTRRVKRIERELKTLKASSGTSMYDAAYFASRSLRYREGRRVIVLVTDGADTTSVKSFQQALEAAHNTDVVIYGIMILPVTSNAGRNIGGENALITLATGTGGRVFAASLGKVLDNAFDSILRDLRTQYLIGYYPRNLPYSRERFRKVEVRVAQPGLRVITRTGYYGEKREPPSQAPSQGGPTRKPTHQE